jgi:hypothetical protein
MPVAVTTASRRPRVTTVFMKTMPCCSARGIAGHGVGVLGDRRGFAGEGCLGHLGAWASSTRASAATRRRLPAGAYRRAPGWRPRPPARSRHGAPGRWGRACRAGPPGALGAVLLDVAEGGVEEHHHPDDDGVLHLAQQAGHHRCADQHQYQQVGELVGEASPGRARWFLVETVWAVAAQAAGGGVGGQTLVGVAIEPAGHLGGGQGVPGRGAGRGLMAPCRTSGRWIGWHDVRVSRGWMHRRPRPCMVGRPVVEGHTDYPDECFAKTEISPKRW